MVGTKKTRNRAIMKQLKKQLKRRLRQVAIPHLDKILTKWQVRMKDDSWLQEQQSQTPKQLWAHRNMLTAYQVWVTYRMATLQLNLYYPGAEKDHRCPLDTECEDKQNTVTHITWDCRRAQAFWSKLLAHWLGHEITTQMLATYKRYMASRKVPPIGECFQKRMLELYGQWNNEFLNAAERIWWVMCSMGYTLLWQLRNQVVHDGQQWPAHQHLEHLWGRCTRQLRAIAAREAIRPKTRTQGIQLRLSVDCLAAMTATQAQPGPMPPPERRRPKKPALMARLKTYQESNN